MAVVVGADSEVGAAIIGRLRASGRDPVAVTRQPADSAQAASAGCADAVGALTWDPRSPLATRSMVLSLSVAAPIDLCVVVEGTLALEAQPLHDLHLFEVDRVVDEHVKSYLFLLRELLRHGGDTRDRQAPDSAAMQLALVRTRSPGAGDQLPPLQACVTGAFTALADTLIAADTHPGTELMLFEPTGGAAGDEPLRTTAERKAYADFVVDTLEAAPGNRRGRHRFRTGRRRLPRFYPLAPLGRTAPDRHWPPG